MRTGMHLRTSILRKSGNLIGEVLPIVVVRRRSQPNIPCCGGIEIRTPAPDIVSFEASVLQKIGILRADTQENGGSQEDQQ